MVAMRPEQVSPVIGEDPLWTLEYAAKYLEVSMSQLRRFYRSHDLEVTSLGPKIIRVRKSQVEDFIRNHTGPWSRVRRLSA